MNKELIIIIKTFALTFLIFTLIFNSFAYTTEQTLAFNKLFSSANLTESQQLTLFEYLEQQNLQKFNQTQLIENELDNVFDSIDNLRESCSDNFTLLVNQIDDIRLNISNFEPKNDKVRELELQKEIIIEMNKGSQDEELDPFSLYLKELKNKETQTTSSYNLSNYYTKSQINDKLEEIREDIETNNEPTEPLVNNQNQITQNFDYATKNYVLTAIILLIGALGGLYYRFLKPQFEKNKELIKRIQELEKKVEKKI